MQERGLFENTMIVFTSDHGDYLGDHWLGEKDLFHEPSVKVPLIVYDPSPAADPARGTRCEALVEAIKNLPEREGYVMSMYYEHDMNLKEIAAVLKVTESRVCQLHSQAIARLRVKLRDW